MHVPSVATAKALPRGGGCLPSLDPPRLSKAPSEATRTAQAPAPSRSQGQ